MYLVDNSPDDKLKDCVIGSNIIYIHNPSNPGFGAAHNVGIDNAINWGSVYHFVINPDVSARGEVIKPMIDYMEANPNVGMLMPEILNNDGSSQNLPKLLPTPFSILLRKIKFPTFIYRKFINQYELQSVPKDQIYQAPILSGCFTLFRIEALKKIGLYDDRFFMYFEDWDISRRMNEKYQTIYYPKVSIYHGYESGANKSLHLFKIFVKSAFSYFNKWGWFFDKHRSKVNRQTLSQFQ